MENLIENLKGYQAKGLDLKAAGKKLYEKDGLVLSKTIEKFQDKNLTLAGLITKLEKINESKNQFEKAIDGFATEEAKYPRQQI